MAIDRYVCVIVTYKLLIVTYKIFIVTYMILIVTYNFIAWSMRPSLVVSMDTKNENQLKLQSSSYSQVYLVQN